MHCGRMERSILAEFRHNLLRMCSSVATIPSKSFRADSHNSLRSSNFTTVFSSSITTVLYPTIAVSRNSVATSGLRVLSQSQPTASSSMQSGFPSQYTISRSVQERYAARRSDSLCSVHGFRLKLTFGFQPILFLRSVATATCFQPEAPI